jgi:integrase
MAPRLHSQELETRTARRKLKPRRKPYSVNIAPTIRLGYRRNAGPGTWSVICADGQGGSWIKRLSLADDHEDANGKSVLDFWQAADEAKKIARDEDGVTDSTRPATVAQAIGIDYRAELIANGKQTKNADELLGKLTSALASKPVSMVTTKDLRDFRNRLLSTGIKRCTVTRYMNSLLAALRLAAKLDKRIKNASEWKLDPLPDDTEPVDSILSDKEVAALVAAAWAQPDQDFALLVEVVAQTGCRISQAIRLNVEDPLTGDRLNMPSSFKGRGKATYHKRPIPITPSLWKKLANAAAGRKGDEPLLTDADGTRWYKNCQSSRFPAIAKAAGVKATTYAFRHSSIVRALLLNVPIRLVAANHDTSVAKIEKTYSRFITTPGEALTRRALLDFAPPAADNVPMVR